MQKAFAAWLLMCCLSLFAFGQQAEKARANVVPYIDDAAAIRLAYREQPYLMELSEDWTRTETDSSLRYFNEINVERDWRDFDIYLQVACRFGVRVRVNGRAVGVADDSRHRNEFRLTPYLLYGHTNYLTVEVLRSPAGALLEDAQQEAGLIGWPTLLFKSAANVSDYTVVADWDEPTHSATLQAEVQVRALKNKGKYYVEAEVLTPQGQSIGRMGKWVIVDKQGEGSVSLARRWNDVSPWTAETPVLYTLLLRIRNEKMEEQELVSTKVGFRHIEIKDGLLLLNGKAITLKGIVYGPAYSEGTAAREQMRRDVSLMKTLGVNAVRTARYSPIDPFFYELCDAEGLYVVADANLLPQTVQGHAVATRQELVPLFEHRVENLYGRYKIHPSIIAWGLGNTDDNAVGMTAAYRHLKTLDATRPVLFSAAEMSPNTDIIAPRNPSYDMLRQMVSKRTDRPVVVLSAGEQRPFEELQRCWQLVEDRQQLQGIFVDEWPLDETKQADLTHLYRVCDVQLLGVKPDAAEVLICNRNDFSPLANYSLQYTLFTNLRPQITGGELPLVVMAGECDKQSLLIPQLNLKPSEELFVRFNVRERVVNTARQSSTMAERLTLQYSIPHATPSRPKATPTGMPDTAEAAPSPTLFFMGHPEWTAEEVGLQHRWADSTTYCTDRMMRYLAPNGSVVCDVRETRASMGQSDRVLEFDLSPSEQGKHQSLQPSVFIPCQADSIRWLGDNRHTALTLKGVSLVDTYTDAFRPMQRDHVRWCAVKSGEECLFLQFLDHTCELRVVDSGLVLTPHGQGHFRLRTSRVANSDVANAYGIDYPSQAAAIIEPPTIRSSMMRFSEPMQVSISAGADCTVRYTIDGSEPDETSPLYTQPFTITTTTTVKARAYQAVGHPSFTATRRFNYDHIVATSFSRPPNTPYNVGSDTLLFDGLTGRVDDMSRGWLGFAGGDVVTDVRLAHAVPIDAVHLRYAHSPATWAFAPSEVLLLFSTDGEHFADTLRAALPFNPADSNQQEPRVVELLVPCMGRVASVVRIVPHSLPTLPPWHRGKGLKPWLLMDELKIDEYSTPDGDNTNSDDGK